MATFIDEQGGIGWKPGSHRHFRLTAVWLPTPRVEAFAESIRELRRQLHLKTDFEFKFAETHDRPEWRIPFYQTAINCGFFFTTCSYDKTRIIPAGSIEKDEFFWGCATTLAAYLRQVYLRAEMEKCDKEGKPVPLREQVMVDDNEDPKFLKAIKTAFRGLKSGSCPKTNLIGQVRFRDSESNDMLQLADMVMGAVGAYLDGANHWYNHISARDLGVVRLP